MLFWLIDMLNPELIDIRIPDKALTDLIAELRLEVHNMNLRHESMRNDINRRAQERMKIAVQLHSLGFTLTPDGEIIKPS